ncbi:Scr1 family TA system antitoxin-like transcriptional regulator [Streptomyces sp. NPDC087850]|uniref:Scr1 family TA system antitoxin-like transcriptional regulator n=1 Tax=Streptomyces sp. NPDC087850 TaxID=3365809 RepID=UPI00380B3AFA
MMPTTRFTRLDAVPAPAVLTVLLDGPALLRPAQPEEMADQLARLQNAADHGQIRVLVAPSSADARF